jgi:NhaA family Na+:H+ antiporter
VVQPTLNNRLDRPVDDIRDHILGASNAAITLVEYGSYACPHCRAANERISEIRHQFGDRLRYVYRHQPLIGSSIARRAAELAERASSPQSFWEAHLTLMTRSGALTEDDLLAVARDLRVSEQDPEQAASETLRARMRVDEDELSALASGALITPTFFINGRRYDGPWDDSSFTEAIVGTLSHRVRSAALDFASWAPSAGILLLIAAIVAVALTNSSVAQNFSAFWLQPLGVILGPASFALTFLQWINDALLTVFFLVVGLEVKREFTVGHLASLRAAALPIAGAIGGMLVPAFLYSLVIPSGAWAAGWGIPMATDTAFAVALLVVMGSRVPVELRIFLTAAAIVDDIGSILVVALFYSNTLHMDYLAAAAALCGGLAFLSRARVYSFTPYLLLGIALWVCVHASGLHATVVGALLAMFVPTRAPPNLQALVVQANTIMEAEHRRNEEVLRNGPSLPALRALDAIHDRLESPADRLLRYAGAPSSYVVLPLFALANAGVVASLDVLRDHWPLVNAIVIAMVVGKPLGLVSVSALAVWLRVAVKPADYSWRQLVGAGALAGIGFTMSLFIAGEAFSAATDFAAAKVAVFAASIISAIIGYAVLSSAGRRPGGGCVAAEPLRLRTGAQCVDECVATYDRPCRKPDDHTDRISSSSVEETGPALHSSVSCSGGSQ